MVGLDKDARVEDLKSWLFEAFESHFRSRNGVHVLSWDVDFPKLDKVELEFLERPFFEEEIYRELKEANGNKVTGPDGFTFKFA